MLRTEKWTRSPARSPKRGGHSPRQVSVLQTPKWTVVRLTDHRRDRQVAYLEEVSPLVTSQGP